MMTKDQAVKFAIASAHEAIDQKDAYENSYDSYKENVRDTLNDEKASEFEFYAFEAFDAEYARLTK